MHHRPHLLSIIKVSETVEAAAERLRALAHLNPRLIPGAAGGCWICWIPSVSRWVLLWSAQCVQRILMSVLDQPVTSLKLAA